MIGYLLYIQWHLAIPGGQISLISSGITGYPEQWGNGIMDSTEIQ